MQNLSRERIIFNEIVRKIWGTDPDVRCHPAPGPPTTSSACEPVRLRNASDFTFGGATPVFPGRHDAVMQSLGVQSSMRDSILFRYSDRHH